MNIHYLGKDIVNSNKIITHFALKGDYCIIIHHFSSSVTKIYKCPLDFYNSNDKPRVNCLIDINHLYTEEQLFDIIDNYKCPSYNHIFMDMMNKESYEFIIKDRTNRCKQYRRENNLELILKQN